MWKDSSPQLCVCVCVKADSLLLSCNSESSRTLRAQFPQFCSPPMPWGEGLCVLGKVALLWRAEEESLTGVFRVQVLDFSSLSLLLKRT